MLLIRNFLALDYFQLAYIIIAGCYLLGAPYQIIGLCYLAMAVYPKH